MDKVAVLKKLDKFLGSALLLFLSRAEEGQIPKKDDIKKLLVIKTVAIGDLVLLLPTIRALKETFPNAELTLLTTPRVKEVIEGSPYIDKIIYYDILGRDQGLESLLRVIKKIKNKKFDLSVDFEHYYNFTAIISRLAGIRQMAGFDIVGQIRKKLFNLKIPYDVSKHEVEAFYEAAKVLGAVKNKFVLQEITTSEKDKHFVEQFLKRKKIKSHDFVVCIHPSTSSSAKVRRWLPERFAEVVDALISDYKAKVVITGSADDKEIIQSIALKTKNESIVWELGASLKKFAELCRRCNLSISVDTGPMHISAAMGTKTIGLFGPNTPHKWGPYGFQELAVYKKPDCSPCTKQYLGQVSKCRTGDCMKEITAEDVLQKVKKALT